MEWLSSAPKGGVRRGGQKPGTLADGISYNSIKVTQTVEYILGDNSEKDEWEE